MPLTPEGEYDEDYEEEEPEEETPAEFEAFKKRLGSSFERLRKQSTKEDVENIFNICNIEWNFEKRKQLIQDLIENDWLGWTLYVDCREPKAEAICEQLRSYAVNAKVSIPTDDSGGEEVPGDESPKINAKVDSLSVADFWFAKDDKVWCMVERKTIPDLLASIINDHRYKDQVARMIKAQAPFMFYLIIGSLDEIDQSSRQTIDSALLHMQMLGNLKVSQVKREGFVVPYLVRMYQYLSQTPSLDGLTAPFVEFVQTNCKKRKLNTQKDVFIAQLCCIDGMSELKAKAVQKHYNNFPELMNAYKDCQTHEQRTMLLKDIQVSKTKIGPVLSEKVYGCIMDANYKPRKKAKKDS